MNHYPIELKAKQKIYPMLKTFLASLLVLACGVAYATEPEGAAIVARHQAVFTAPPVKIPSDTSTDAPLLGNGDFLVVFAGPPEKQQFYLGKADLWELRVMGDSRPLGRLDVELPGMKGASYRVTQELRRAITTGVYEKNGTTLTVESAVAATENLLWVKLSAAGGEISGTAGLRRPGQSGPTDSRVADNGRPAIVGREAYGNGRYYFDGEIADLSISGTPAAAPPIGKPKEIRAFDGKTSWHELPIPAMSQAVQVSAWIKIRGTAEANYIVSKGEWNQAYSLGLSSGCLRWSVNGRRIQTDNPLPKGQWLHVAGSFDRGTMRLAVDGKTVAGDTEGGLLLERRFEKGVARPTGAACALRVLNGGHDGFTVAPGKPVILLVAAAGLANTKDFRADVIRRAAAATPETLAGMRQAHEAWWAAFWNKSFVEIPDKALEQRYYLSHYCVACCSRLPHFPPGLIGWPVMDQPRGWSNTYFNNYNFFAPFYGAYTANHIEQAMPCNDAVIDALELGRDWCRDEAKYEQHCGNSLKLKNMPGVLLPVSMMPFGVLHVPTSWGQRSNASYACLPLASTWYATYDPNFARRAYPFVRETATFWEHYLVLENGRYVDRNDAVHENSGRDTNPIHTLALIRLVLELAEDMSTALGVDADRHAKWRDIRDRLSDYPQCTVADLPKGAAIGIPRTPENLALPIFRLSEAGYAWHNAGNTVVIQHIFPGNGIGLGVRPELLERARNTLTASGRWIDLNGCNSFYPAAVRVGYDPEAILKHLRHWVDTASPNGQRADNMHSTEQFSVVPCTIQEMLMQSYDGTLRLFPCWPKDQDAKFGTLRARGAFLVSAEMKNGMVTSVRIVSEKGRDCTVQNPWPGRKVSLAGRETLTGERFTFKTTPEEIIEFKPEGVKP